MADLDKREVRGFGRGWCRRGTSTLLSLSSDQIVLVESGVFGFDGGGTAASGDVIFVPAGEDGTMTVESWAATTVDVELGPHVDGLVARGVVHSRSWKRDRINAADRLTLDAGSSYIVAALSGEIALGDMSLSRQLAVVRPDEMIELRSIEEGELLVIELSGSLPR